MRPGTFSPISVWKNEYNEVNRPPIGPSSPIQTTHPDTSPVIFVPLNKDCGSAVISNANLSSFKHRFFTVSQALLSKYQIQKLHNDLSFRQHFSKYLPICTEILWTRQKQEGPKDAGASSKNPLLGILSHLAFTEPNNFIRGFGFSECNPKAAFPPQLKDLLMSL